MTGRAHPEPKRHHTLPEMIQKRFVDDAGYLHAFDRRRSDLSVFRTHPGKLFVKKHLYRRTEADGSTDTDAEKWLSRLEDKADPVIEKIVRNARQGRPPGLTPGEFETWLLFMFMQWKRVPDLHRDVATDAEVEATFDELLAALRRRRPDKMAEIDSLDTPENRRRMMHNTRVDVLMQGGAEPLAMLRLRGLGVARIVHPNKQFVLASRPVVKLTQQGREHLLDPTCEMWLAVAPDIIVGLGPGPGSERLVGVTDPDKVRAYNQACVGQSTVFASSSAALVRSLASAR